MYTTGPGRREAGRREPAVLIIKPVATVTSARELQRMAGHGRFARLARWRRAWRSGRMDEPWRVGPLVAFAEPAVAALGAVVALLLALRLGFPLTPGGFLLAVPVLAFLGHLWGRRRVSNAFRRWARLAADLPFSLSGAERLLRRSASSIRVEIRFAGPLLADVFLLRSALDATAVPGAALELAGKHRGRLSVVARGHAWAATWSVRRLLSVTLPAFHEVFPIERVDLCPPVLGLRGPEDRARPYASR